MKISIADKKTIQIQHLLKLNGEMEEHNYWTQWKFKYNTC